MSYLIALIAVSLVASATLAFFAYKLSQVAAERDALLTRFKGVLDAEAEALRIQRAIAGEQESAQLQLAESSQVAEERRATLEAESHNLEKEITEARAKRQNLQSEISILDEQAHLFSFGLYTPRFDCSSSALFSERLDGVRTQQKAMLKGKRAAVGEIEWTVNGSKVQGRKQINQTLKLMLRAFNGECDAAVAKVRYNNIHVMEARIVKAYEAINGLTQVQQCRITPEYLQLKLDELHLEFEYEQKVQAEKEEQRRIREMMREEEIAQREIEKVRLDAEKQEERTLEALAKAQSEAANAVGPQHDRLQARIADLEKLLAEAHERKERAISRAQLTRSGHIYVVSNIGSFGEHLYKIGMTRRLDPLDRIKELGDASVPFEFDIHAIIYADDAPALEAELHRSFSSKRVNRVNERKEFFRVSIEEIADVVRKHRGEIEFTLAAEAADYRKTLSVIEAERCRIEQASLSSNAPS